MTAAEIAATFRQAKDKVTDDAMKPADRSVQKKSLMEAPPGYVHPDTLRPSQPFYISRLAQCAIDRSGGASDAGDAAYERQESGRLKKALRDAYGSGANYSQGSFVIPLAWECMPEDVRRSSDFEPLRKAMAAALDGIDPDRFLGKDVVGVYGGANGDRLYKTAMSYTNQTTGGALVAPPQFGDLIPILRNKAVLQNIGATNVPLPTQGSVKYPRQTSVVTVEEVPENTAGTEANPTFDDVTLEPKQFICLVRASNQLLTFAPGVAEAAIRADMSEQAALKFDLQGLQGAGGPNRVKGLINQAGISTVVAYTTGTNGNTWTPRDTARMLRAAMVRNSDVKTWIMRPDMWLGITETRADAVVPGDASGNYLFHMLREFSSDFGENLRQRKVVTSNQVVNTRTKGSATDLTYILGVDGSEVLVGMHGAMVLDANPYETTAYTSNQTLLRAIMFGDVGIRRGAGIVFMDTLIVPNLDS